MCVPPAAAQEDGVHIDPGSPAGQEYALPFARARDQATGRPSDRPPKSAGAVQPFGEGVRPPGRDGGGGETSTSGGGGEKGTGAAGGKTTPARGSKPVRDPGAAAARLAAATSPGDAGAGWTLGVGLAILVGGGLLGLGLSAATRRDRSG
jgi:hypothetical protein